MVSKASDDFPEPLGPVTTVNLPSGRSTSTPLRLFWRAPQTSTQFAAAGSVTHFFSVTFEPTGYNSRWRCNAQISLAENTNSIGEAVRSPWDANSVPYSLLFETPGELLALLEQLLGNDTAERVEELLVCSQLFLPFLVVDTENLDDALVLNIEVGKIDIVRAGQPADGRFDRAAAFFTAIDDPFQDSHIVAEAGPQEFSILT